MKLEFLFAPTTDLQASLAFYRDVLGWDEAWREGDTTVAMTIPGSAVQLMLDAAEPEAPAGPVYVVDSVTDFHARRPGSLTVLADPEPIPDGFVATYAEPAGTVFYVLDQSGASA